MSSFHTEPEDVSLFDLRGIEVDNLLGVLALLGTLRALERARADWRPRVSWSGPPWVARLHVAAHTNEHEVSSFVCQGLTSLAEELDVDGRANVDFEPAELRTYLRRIRIAPGAAGVASAIAAEHPRKRDGGLYAGPLVMMFGQGHQNFLERLVAVATGNLKGFARKELNAPAKILDALVRRWRRGDPTPSFRWDPEEDQRYALRFGDPSTAGAAATVHGANRLAIAGLSSFPCLPATSQQIAVGTRRQNGEVHFVWPIWTTPLSLHAVERLFAHPAVTRFDLAALDALGVAEIYRARRVSNGRFMNVSRATAQGGQGQGLT